MATVKGLVDWQSSGRLVAEKLETRLWQEWQVLSLLLRIDPQFWQIAIPKRALAPLERAGRKNDNNAHLFIEPHCPDFYSGQPVW
jgi:hypothetical protein